MDRYLILSVLYSSPPPPLPSSTTGCVSVVGVTVLVLVNLLLMLLSVTMLVCAGLLLAGTDISSSLPDTMEGLLKDALRDAGVTSVDADNLSLTGLMQPLAYLLLLLGGVMGVIALLGCLGGCCSNRCVLVIYAGVTIALFLGQAVAVTFIYADRSTFDAAVKPYILGTLADYSGIEGEETDTLAWNALMRYEGCCGVDGFQDFRGLAHWPPAAVRGVALHDLYTPLMCCKTVPDVKAGYRCAQTGTANADNNYLNTGCYDKLFDLVMNNEVVLVMFVSLFALQFSMAFFSIWVVCKMGDRKVGVV